MSTVINKFTLPSRFDEQVDSVWEEYIQLAYDYKPVDLGQGFPDFHPPKELINALAEVTGSDNALLHQYTRGCGHTRLVTVLAALYSKFIGREIDPFKEVLITGGAYGALYYSIIGHVDVGDEVIIIEPFFDCYEPMIKYAGGIPRFVPLRCKKTSDILTSGDWRLDKQELESIFNAKTKAIIVNTPNNPCGKVYTEEELLFISNLCIKWNVICISDEVYEWMIYKPNKHVRIASLSGMWERTITIGSAGKTFSITGWKTGWAYGPSDLMRNLQVVHLNSFYTCSTPLQEAIAVGFENEIKRLGDNDCYFNYLPAMLEKKRNYMNKIFEGIGLKPIIPEGGYFMMVDWTSLATKLNLSDEKDSSKDYAFTKWLTKNIGVQGIPPSAFYSAPHKKLGENFVRFCFIKEDVKLIKAGELLKQLKQL